jgi:hypothetical protein
MLTSKITKVIDHPDEPGVTFTLRKMSHHQLSMAADAKRDAALKLMKSFEGVTLPEVKDDAKQAADNPENKYDRETVLRYGVTDWTYDAECNDDNKRDLDEGTAAWLFAAIIVHSTRSADDVKASASDSPLTSEQAAAAGQAS